MVMENTTYVSFVFRLFTTFSPFLALAVPVPGKQTIIVWYQAHRFPGDRIYHSFRSG